MSFSQKNPNCLKCASNDRIHSGHYAEVWSGFVRTEQRWFDIGLLRKILKPYHPIPKHHIVTVSVEELWANQIYFCEFDVGHLDHVDLTIPIFLATTHEDEQGDHVSVIDGINRCARAHRDAIPTLPALHLTRELTRMIEIPPREAVLSELLNEIAHQPQATIQLMGDMILIQNADVRPQGPTDHPVRAELIAVFTDGTAILPVPKR